MLTYLTGIGIVLKLEVTSIYMFVLGDTMHKVSHSSLASSDLLRVSLILDFWI